MIKTKPTGPIPPGYEAIDGELAIGDQKASQLVSKNGSPLFVYSSGRLNERMMQLRAAMPDALDLHYAMKANPFQPLLRHMVNLRMALTAGAAPEHISFAGPGKRDEELQQAIETGVTINIESPSECERALKIGAVLDKKPRLAIRVNPDFDLKGSGMKMGGGAKPFGMDIDLVAPTVKQILDAGADWRGFHIFAGSQALSADAIIETQAQTLELAGRLATMIGQAPDHVNLGGGFGIPYFPGDEQLDIVKVGKALAKQFEHLPDILSSTQFAIELGRYLVGEAGIYLTRIVDRKESQGQTFLVTDGGLHHQLAASGNFGTVGDIVAIFCAGAYGATASPANFLGQGPARELLVG